MRRLLLLVLVVPLSAGSLVAQESTPTTGSEFDDLGLPSLDITVTADG